MFGDYVLRFILSSVTSEKIGVTCHSIESRKKNDTIKSRLVSLLSNFAGNALSHAKLFGVRRVPQPQRVTKHPDFKPIHWPLALVSDMTDCVDNEQISLEKLSFFNWTLLRKQTSRCHFG